MTSPDDRPDRPESDEERTWAELVQAFHASSDHSAERRWPAAEDLDPDDDRGDLYGSPSDALTADDLLSAPVVDDDPHRGHEAPADDSRDGPDRPEYRAGRDDPGRPDDGDTLAGPRPAADGGSGNADTDHFVPPPPPPIPRGDLVSRLAWAGVIGPPSLILLSGLLSISLPLNVMGFLAVAFIAGFGILISRMRGHHPSDPDDGAVL